MDVSIIIVNYNTKQLLADCIKTVYEQTVGITFEVIVSDNGSADGSIEMLKADFPQVVLIENNANLGFGAANNRGLAIAKGKYIFYLNSDTILLNNAVKIFFDYWEENGEKERIGALGANLLNNELKIIHSYGNFIRSKTFINELIHTIYGITKLSFQYIFLRRNVEINPSDKIKEEFIGSVEYITGADLFLKNDENAKFDENYFMYAEEADLQYELDKQNKKRLLIDGPKIIHLGGGSAGKTQNLIKINGTFSHIYNNISRTYFIKKHTKNIFTVMLIKILILMLWCNPFLIKKTSKYFGKLLSI